MTELIALYGYGFAGIMSLALTALLIIGLRGSWAGISLVVASTTTCLWSVGHAAIATKYAETALLLAITEPLRPLFWIVFLVIISESPGKGAWTLVSMALLASAAWAGGIHFGSLETSFTAALIMAIIVLHLVEQLYRNSEPTRQWAIKFLAISLVIWFGFDFVMYAEALLFSGLDKEWWAIRGVITGITIPLIAVSAARNRAWRVEVAVSRAVVFHTTMLLSTGIYLVLAALAGAYVRRYGGSWGVVAQSIVLTGAAAVLLTVMLSGRVRAQIKVQIAKHFFTYRYDYRNEWLRFTAALIGDQEKQGSDERIALPRRIIQAIAALVDSTGGGLWIRQENTFVVSTLTHFPATNLSVPAEDPLIQMMENKQWIIEVNELELNPALYDNLSIPSWLSEIRKVWILVPLIAETRLIGFVVLLDPLGPKRLNWEVRDILKVAARQAAGSLRQMTALEELLQAQQFAAFNRMSAFVVHDLKNLVAQLNLMLGNAQRHARNPAFQADMLATVQNVSERMKGLLLQLRAGTTPVERAASINVIEIVEQAVHDKLGLRPRPTLQIDAALGAIWVAGHADRIARVVGHLIQNACEATPPDGSVLVHLHQNETQVVIDVKDSGCGMTPSFIRERLFKPFESTKTHGMGIGVFESRDYVHELGGQLNVQSHLGTGSCFSIMLPIIASHPVAQGVDSEPLRGVTNGE